jgi:tRNA-splicing ligase RtcB
MKRVLTARIPDGSRFGGISGFLPISTTGSAVQGVGHRVYSRQLSCIERRYADRNRSERARAGEDLGIIPGSMGTGTYIVRGLGSSEAFESAPHGAGRRMSRTEARRRFTAEDLVCQTEGVECRKDVRVVDEIPGAYKPIEEIIEKSSDLVEVVAFIRQVICVKG